MVFFSDMDGTFLDSRKAVPEVNLRALDALAGRGIEFVPCTGRPLSGLAPELLRHPAVRHAITSNGASVYAVDETGSPSLVHASPLALDKALEVLGIARGRDVTFDVFADGDCLLRRDLLERIPEFVDDPYVVRSMVDTRTPVDEEPEETLRRVGTIERVAMYWKDPADRDGILEGLERVGGIAVTRSYPTNIEVMDARCSKGAGMAWLCAEIGVPVSDAVAFGDNLNDVTMIRAAGRGVAVANAEPEARAAADAACPSNDEGGVGRFILESLGAA